MGHRDDFIILTHLTLVLKMLFLNCGGGTVFLQSELTVHSLITCLFCQLCMHEELSLWVCFILMELCVSVVFIVIDGFLGGSREHIYGAGVGCNRTDVEFVKLMTLQ